MFRTKLGTAMRAVSFDFDAASLMGVPVDRVVSFTFVLGSALAAAAGFLYALKYPGLEPAGAFHLGAAGVESVCGGGDRRHRQRPRRGAGRVRDRRRSSSSARFTCRRAYRDVYVFALLIVILLVRPSGLLGSTGARESMTADEHQTVAGTARIVAHRRVSARTAGLSSRSVWPIVAGHRDRGRDALHCCPEPSGRITRGS